MLIWENFLLNYVLKMIKCSGKYSLVIFSLYTIDHLEMWWKCHPRQTKALLVDSWGIYQIWLTHFFYFKYINKFLWKRTYNLLYYKNYCFLSWTFFQVPYWWFRCVCTEFLKLFYHILKSFVTHLFKNKPFLCFFMFFNIFLTKSLAFFFLPYDFSYFSNHSNITTKTLTLFSKNSVLFSEKWEFYH